MVNFMGNIEKGKGDSLEKLRTLLESAPILAKRAATDLVDKVVYEVQVRLDQGAVRPLSQDICLLVVLVSTRLVKPASAVALLMLCLSWL